MRFVSNNLRLPAFVITCIGLAYMSLVPIPKDPGIYMEKALPLDYAFHAVAYCLLAFTVMMAFVKQPATLLDRVNIFLWCILAGSLLEILQAVIPGINRTCTVSDFLYNGLGSAIGAFLTPSAWLVASSGQGNIKEAG
jgi:VanZ family protein